MRGIPADENMSDGDDPFGTMDDDDMAAKIDGITSAMQQTI